MNTHPTQPMVVIVSVLRQDGGTDRLVMECGHMLQRPRRGIWNRRTACDKCPPKVCHGQ